MRSSRVSSRCNASCERPSDRSNRCNLFRGRLPPAGARFDSFESNVGRVQPMAAASTEIPRPPESLHHHCFSLLAPWNCRVRCRHHSTLKATRGRRAIAPAVFLYPKPSSGTFPVARDGGLDSPCRLRPPSLGATEDRPQARRLALPPKLAAHSRVCDAVRSTPLFDRARVPHREPIGHMT